MSGLRGLVWSGPPYKDRIEYLQNKYYTDSDGWFYELQSDGRFIRGSTKGFVFGIDAREYFIKIKPDWILK